MSCSSSPSSMNEHLAIPFNGPMVLNDTTSRGKWYSVIFSGISLALFCKGP